MRGDHKIIEEEFIDYTEFLEKIRNLESKIKKVEDPIEQNKLIREMVSMSVNFSDEIAQSGELFEAGELLFSTAEIIENLNFSEALELYSQIIEHYKKLIINFKLQAKLHEIAELYLRIADIYRDKFQDFNLERKNIMNSIKFLNQECKLLEEFNETRKLAQNYQNMAELYFKLSNFKNAIKNFKKVIDISKMHNYYDMLSFSYQQIASSYEEIDDYTKSQEIILGGVDYFTSLITNYEQMNDNLTLSQIYQILKNLNKILDEEDQYINFTKKEAGAYIDLAETIEKKKRKLP